MEELEEWVDIIGYEGIYQVSDKGRVKRLSGHCLAKAGKYRTVAESILTCFPNKTRYNYLYVNLNNNGIKQYRVNVLVAKHFIENPLNLPEVNHIDGDKNNNQKTNLEWSTKLDNMRHSYKIGTHKIRTGEKAPNSKLTLEQVVQIKEKLAKKESGRSIAKDFNISEGMISLIKNNKYWT
jgi:hypothetical protein